MNRNKKFDKRIEYLQSILVLVVATFVIYLFLTQVLDVRRFKDRAKQRTNKIFVLRGEIVDKKGLKLATDKTTFDLYAHPKYYDHTPEELAEFLAPITGLGYATLKKKLTPEENDIILVKRGLERKVADKIRKGGYREFSLDIKNKRMYPQGILASHILGYYNPNADIASGIEQTGRKYLEYLDKSITYERTRDGNIIYNLSTNPADLTAPIKGKTLELTIDSAIQHVCEKYLYKKIKETNAKRGAVAVIEPSTGEILALAVYPYYDPNDYSKYSNEEKKNWALTDVYPPGSTFKVITVASGLISGKINKRSRIADTGKMKVGWWEIKNYDYKKNPNPGLVDLVYLFIHSSNVASAKIAMMMPEQEFYDILRMFGFGEKTGIDLPGESTGLLPKPKKWDSATRASMGYGYGASVTVIQMAAAIAAIANKGVWITPHIIKYSPEELESKVIQRRVMEEWQAADLTNILVKAIDEGKSIVKNQDFQIAAKTGTSRRPKENGLGYTNKLYTSMIGFLPASNPKVAIYVIVDSPSGEGIWGSTVAAPIFKDICEEVIKILNLTPDKIHTSKNGD